MCAQEAKCNQIIDLLDPHTPQKEIAKIVGVSERTVWCILHAKKLSRGTKRSPASGSHHRKRNKVFFDTLKNKIAEDSTVSMRRYAKTLNVDPKTIRNVVTLELGLKSFVRQAQHLLNESIKLKRFDRCIKILSFLKNNGRIIKVFSDKKIFTVDQVYSRRNDC